MLTLHQWRQTYANAVTVFHGALQVLTELEQHHLHRGKCFCIGTGKGDVEQASVTPESRLQSVQAMLGENLQALTAVVEYSRGGQSHVQVIQRMAPAVAVPALPGGPRYCVGITRLVALRPERLGMTERQLLSLVRGTELHGLLCFCLAPPGADLRSS